MSLIISFRSDALLGAIKVHSSRVDCIAASVGEISLHISVNSSSIFFNRGDKLFCAMVVKVNKEHVPRNLYSFSCHDKSLSSQNFV